VLLYCVVDSRHTLHRRPSGFVLHLDYVLETYRCCRNVTCAVGKYCSELEYNFSDNFIFMFMLEIQCSHIPYMRYGVRRPKEISSWNTGGWNKTCSTLRSWPMKHLQSMKYTNMYAPSCSRSTCSVTHDVMLAV
jgi:hypothetical protein